MIPVCSLLKIGRNVNLLRNVCLSRNHTQETHYDILQLPRNCSQKEIKNAFIKLSMQYHPDKSIDAGTHNKFVKLNEAYTVLIRPDSRKEYDLSFVPPGFTVPRSPRTPYDTDTFNSQGQNSFRDSSFWENRDKSKDAENLSKPYYGIKGIKKASNSWILSLLFMFTVFGVGLQVLLIKKSVTFSRKALDEESSRNANIYKQVRATAMAEDSELALMDRLQKNLEVVEAGRSSLPASDQKQ